MRSLHIDRDAALDVFNIASGLFAPLKGFLVSEDYRKVVHDMRLDSGEPWTLPITLDLPENERREYTREERIYLRSEPYGDMAVLHVEDIFEVGLEDDVKRIYGTADTVHPGVRKELSRSRFRIGGMVEPLKQQEDEFGKYIFTPEETRRIFRQKGWKTIAGFQTRNPIHRAHEYLQMKALEAADGLFVNPLIGWKKDDDFSPHSIIESYRVMAERHYPAGRAFFGILRTQMRYAGPREAVFHAIIRKNYGCTHFIVGRDHAGVGNYYGKYDAHKIFSEFKDIGIKIIAQYGPFYCKGCGGITTENLCSHRKADRMEVSGTKIRELIRKGIHPPEELMRKDIAGILIRLNREEKAFYGDSEQSRGVKR